VTLRQYLLHLWEWATRFPLPKEDGHYWSGLVGTGEWECLSCGATKYDPDDEDIEEASFWNEIGDTIGKHFDGNNLSAT